MQLIGPECVEWFLLNRGAGVLVSHECHVCLLHLSPSLALVKNGVAVSEGEIIQPVVLLLNMFIPILNALLLFQCLVSLDEVKLLLLSVI